MPWNPRTTWYASPFLVPFALGPDSTGSSLLLPVVNAYKRLSTYKLLGYNSIRLRTTRHLQTLWRNFEVKQEITRNHGEKCRNFIQIWIFEACSIFYPILFLPFSSTGFFLLFASEIGNFYFNVLFQWNRIGVIMLGSNLEEIHFGIKNLLLWSSVL